MKTEKGERKMEKQCWICHRSIKEYNKLVDMDLTYDKKWIDLTKDYDKEEIYPSLEGYFTDAKPVLNLCPLCQMIIIRISDANMKVTFDDEDIVTDFFSKHIVLKSDLKNLHIEVREE
jgi:5,10-methenyltetrahydromethanopterin hydrogenase